MQDNAREFSGMQLFEFEKVFNRDGASLTGEYYELAGLKQVSGDNAYYHIQETLRDLLEKLGIMKYSLELTDESPSYAHSGRTAKLIVRGACV